MHYVAHVHKEGRVFLAEFPDAPGCQTEADSIVELRVAVVEALEGWLEANLASGQAPNHPQPRSIAPDGFDLWTVPVNAALSVAIQLRWARQDAGLSQVELARRAGVSQQQIAKLEDPDENPTIGTLTKVAQALRVAVDVSFTALPDLSNPFPEKPLKSSQKSRRPKKAA